jgi:hypothetical protein
MALLNKVIENKRDEYMINVLEEGTTELESLKTKKYLTENLHMIGKILMEEGVVDAAKQNLANNWGKYAAGAGVVGATGLAIANPEDTAGYVGQGLSTVGADAETTANATKGTFDTLQGAQDAITGTTRQGAEAITGNNYTTSPDEASAKLAEEERMKQLQQEYIQKQLFNQTVQPQIRS